MFIHETDVLTTQHDKTIKQKATQNKSRYLHLLRNVENTALDSLQQQLPDLKITDDMPLSIKQAVYSIGEFPFCF